MAKIYCDECGEAEEDVICRTCYDSIKEELDEAYRTIDDLKEKIENS